MTSLEVVCAKTQNWHQEHLGHVPTANERLTLKHVALAEFEVEFRRALAQADTGGITLDGMPVHLEWNCFGRTLTVENANPSPETPLGRFVAALIERAFDVVTSAECRNSLAQAGNYVGLKLPIEGIPEAKPHIQLTILGVPEDQAEFLAGVDAVARRLRSEPE